MLRSALTRYRDRHQIERSFSSLLTIELHTQFATHTEPMQSNSNNNSTNKNIRN